MSRRFYLPPFLLSITVVLVWSLVGVGQTTRDKFVISAKAGGINAITGGATVTSRGEANWQQLMITDDLDSGDRVKTDDDGRVEILLNPGAYLRLGGNSEIEFVDNTLANLEVKLLRGTAIVEAAGADGVELNIGISTPHTRLAIVRQGLYRVNVIPQDATELIVRKGSVILSNTHTKVKGGNKVIFNATNFSVAKLSDADKKKDDMEVWSKDRAKSLAKANERITNRVLNTALASFRDPFRDPFFLFDRRALGLWFYNPNIGCYTFLPYYFGIGSPYGGFYANVFYSPYVPGYRTNGGWYPGTSNGSNGGQHYPSAGSSSGGIQTGNSGGGSRPAPAPAPSGNGGFGNGGFGREPRSINPETGNPAPRKNLEKMPGQP